MANTLQEYYNIGDDDADTEGGSSGALQAAQTFDAVGVHTIYSVKLLLYRTFTPETITVSIRLAPVQNKPTDTDLCSETFDGNTLTTDTAGEWIEIVFTSPITTVDGTRYAIVVKSDGAYYNWRQDDSSPTYSDGNMLRSTDSGSSWTHYFGTDNMFEVWGEANPPSKPTNPTPADSAIEVDFSGLVLDWDDGGGADTFDVYIGPSGSLVQVASAIAPSTYTVNTSDVPWGQTIYWRIDATNVIGTTTGDIWSFSVVNINSVWLGSGGSFIVVAADDGVFISTDFGSNWTKKLPDGVGTTDWEKVICSSDGTYIIVVSSANVIYRSANNGTSWATITPAGGDTFSVNKLATSDDGQYMIIIGQNSTDPTESCYISVDYGATWTAKKPVTDSIEWTDCDISNDGTIIAVSASGYFYISLDSGATWKEQGMASTAQNWAGLSISGDGTIGLITNLDNNDEFFIGINTELYSEATWAESDLTSAGRALLDDVDVAAQNTTLGFGLGDSPTLTGLTLSGLTATRLVASGSALASVADLTAWIAGTTDHISVGNDGDGTVTLDLDTNTKTLLGSFNGIFLEKIDFTISEAGGTVTGSLEQDGGGDLIQKFSDGYTTLDCTDPVLTIDLTGYVGTNAVPKQVFVYILQSAKTVMAASNSDWPATEHIRIANILLKSAATTGTDGGALVNRNWNDFAFGSDSQGHITHIQDRLRQEPSQWNSGVALTLKASDGSALATGNSSTAIEIVTTAGTVYQLHKHTFPAFDMYTTGTDDVHIVNQPTDEGGAYETTAALVTDVTHYDDGSASGVAIGGNKYFNLVVWGVQNRSGEASHVMINLPTSQYTTEAAAIADANGTSVYDIPAVFKGMGFLIARLTFRLIAGPQWTYIAQEDLRGQIPPISAGVSVTATDHALLANLAFATASHTGFQAQGDVLDDLNTLGVVGANSEFLVGTGAGALTWENASTARTSIGLGNVDNVATDDTAYNATSWNTNTDAATKNAIRDKVETMDTAIGSNTTHRGLSSGNPHSVTPTELSLVIGTDTQAWDTGLDSLAGLGYVSPSMIKITAEDTYTIRTMAEVLSDIGAAASGHNHDATYQPLDDELTSLAALTYAAASFVKMTAANTFALRTIGETQSDLGIDLNTTHRGSDGSDHSIIGSNTTAIGLNTTHRGSDGSDHSYLDQAVTIASTPTLAGLIIADGGTIGQSGGPLLTFDDTSNFLGITGCKVGIGTTTSSLRLGQKLDLATSADFGGSAISVWSTTNSHSGLFEFKKSHHNTIGTHAAVVNGEFIAAISFRGSNGVGFLDAAYIQVVIDGVVTGGGVNDMPGKINFATTPNGAGTSIIRMAIDSTGGIYMNNLKSGSSQGAAGAAVNELWVDTADQTIKLGT